MNSFTPYTSTKLFPWHMATIRRIAVTNATLPIMWAGEFWRVWADVMFPESPSC